ncbi:hypothetical protein DFH27DRAFT_617734 [Peziza echinospora]|nr:hypothetical protein DFH27DRAFT_617734 [Peziza echinospora]
MGIQAAPLPLLPPPPAAAEALSPKQDAKFQTRKGQTHHCSKARYTPTLGATEEGGHGPDTAAESHLRGRPRPRVYQTHDGDDDALSRPPSPRSPPPPPPPSPAPPSPPRPQRQQTASPSLTAGLGTGNTGIFIKHPHHQTFADIQWMNSDGKSSPASFPSRDQLQTDEVGRTYATPEVVDDEAWGVEHDGSC